MRTLYYAALLGGVATGAVIVAVPVVAGPATAGLLLAAFSAGELAGGLAYGGRAWPLRPPARMAVCQVGVAVCLAGLAAATVLGPWAMAPVLVGLGVLVAPVAVIGSALLDDLTDARGLARAYPALVAAGLVGVAAGTWSAGTVTAARGPAAALGVGAAVAAVAAGWIAVRRTALTGYRPVEVD